MSSAPPLRSTWPRRLLRGVALGLAALSAGVGAYLAAAFVLGRMPVNAGWRPTPAGQAVYLASNGVHVDLVLPAQIGERDLRADYPLASGERWAQWMSFGWGDRGFYLEVEEWENLTVRAAVRATLWPTSTLMHVTHERWAPLLDEGCVRITVSDEELAQLLAWVDAGFERDERGAPIRLEGAGYAPRYAGPPDNEFFEARGTYHLFRTCNDWTRQALARAGIRAPCWSPFERPILRQLGGG